MSRPCWLKFSELIGSRRSNCTGDSPMLTDWRRGSKSGRFWKAGILRFLLFFFWWGFLILGSREWLRCAIISRGNIQGSEGWGHRAYWLVSAGRLGVVGIFPHRDTRKKTDSFLPEPVCQLWLIPIFAFLILMCDFRLPEAQVLVVNMSIRWIVGSF